MSLATTEALNLNHTATLNNDTYLRAAEVISNADSLLIFAGSGMNADSGVPDFKNDLGLWGDSFLFNGMTLANWFIKEPKHAWGFYGFLHQLYKQTKPHAGFSILKKWCENKPSDSFIYTSNTDGHFQSSGFAEEMIYECHGSINLTQCTQACTNEVFHTQILPINMDNQQLLPQGKIPTCSYCGNISRPNILMLKDLYWLDSQYQKQHQRFQQWKNVTIKKKVAIIELGVGTSGFSIRHESRQSQGTLIRINPYEPEGNKDILPIRSGACNALQILDALLN